MKYILQIINPETNEIISESKYKSLTKINEDYPQYDYHQLKQIHNQCNGHRVRKLRTQNNLLYSHMRILDNFTKPEPKKQPEVVV